MNDEAFTLSAYADGHVYIAGYTVGALDWQTSAGGYDAFARPTTSSSSSCLRVVLAVASVRSSKTHIVDTPPWTACRRFRCGYPDDDNENIKLMGITDVAEDAELCKTCETQIMRPNNGTGWNVVNCAVRIHVPAARGWGFVYAPCASPPILFA